MGVVRVWCGYGEGVECGCADNGKQCRIWLINHGRLLLQLQ